MKKPVEIMSAVDELSLSILDLGVLSERLEDLRRRYGNGDVDLELFWASLGQISSFLEQYYEEIRFNARMVLDYYEQGILPPSVDSDCSAVALVG